MPVVIIIIFFFLLQFIFFKKRQLLPLQLLTWRDPSLNSHYSTSSELSRCFFLLFFVTVSVVDVCPFFFGSQAVVIIEYVSEMLGNIMITSILVWFL